MEELKIKEILIDKSLNKKTALNLQSCFFIFKNIFYSNLALIKTTAAKAITKIEITINNCPPDII
jgi:hypothetical protein